MIKWLRFIIIIAIIGLLALAYINYKPSESGDSVADRIHSQLQELQSQIADKIPTLADDAKRLMEDIKTKLSQKKEAERQLGAANIESVSKEKSPAETKEDAQLSERMKEMIEKLKQVDAKEMAGNMQELYENWKKLSAAKDDAAPEEKP
ncbi:MAG: hypothetical protein AB1656_06205 [Candidatus Omnitrophota bacterium]